MAGLETHQESSKDAFLTIRSLTKSYAGAPALRDAHVQFWKAEVHGLVGANGAGKSTLIKVLAGTVRPDSGTILLEGREISINSPQRSRAAGLGFVHQELNLIPKFSIMQNLGLGQAPASRIPLLLNKKALHRRAREVMDIVGLNRDTRTIVETLSVAEQWLVCIGRALVVDARFLAMDEPTASLSAAESERLFDVIRSLRGRGLAIAYVSHRLDELLELCDRVTIFRDGRSVGTSPRSELTRESLVSSITSQSIPEGATRRPLQASIDSPGPAGTTGERGTAVPALAMRGISDVGLRDISLSVRRGEIVGIAGLVGSGRTRLLRTLFGLSQPQSGSLWMDGQAVRFKGPSEAIAAGVALIPEERRRQGLILHKSISFNINMATLGKSSPVTGLGLFSGRRANALASEIAGRLQIKYRDIRDPVATLSGGNQQKVVFGRWLARPLKLLLLDEPTRGVDVGARAEIHAVVREIATQGAGVLMVSSEFEELLNCDRVLVLREGRLAGELTGGQINERTMTSMCFGGTAS